jgi:hypothetical protein
VLISVLISVYFGFYLNERAQTKKDKKEAEQIFNILQDEIKSNLDKDFSSEYLPILGEEVLKVKMGVLATYQKVPFGNFVKIYRQFKNINKALSDYNKLDNITSSTNINAINVMLRKSEAENKIIQLQKSCREDIEIHLGKYSK